MATCAGSASSPTTRPLDAPGQAIRCAAAVLAGANAAGAGVRAGVHTGEVSLVGEDIDGASVQIADRVAALARPAEILVSRTVKDLVTGSDITFADRGVHDVTGAGPVAAGRGDRPASG